jgi:hypothetical protein
MLQYADDAAGFVVATGRALAGAPDREACRALARPYDWDELARRMVQEIETRLDAVGRP